MPITVSTTPHRSAHAVVLGASMAGLMTARVLADHFEMVTLVERDDLPIEPEDRRGVPQGRHVHLVQPRCAEVLDELFPGILRDLTASGSPVSTGDGATSPDLSFAGHRMAQPKRRRRPYPLYTPSRRLLEFHVRNRLAELSNVTFLEGHDVAGLMLGSDGKRVCAVRVVDRDTGIGTTLIAGLFVDAMGRGSRMPVFLDELAYGRPVEDELSVQLAYASQVVRMPAETSKNLVLIMPEPGRLTTFVCVGNEDQAWTVTAGSMLGAEPPRDDAEMMEFIGAVAPPELLKALLLAERCSEVNHYRVPSTRWRRYDKLRRFPQGVLVIGDAICSFNPVYGQGMTVAALEVLALRECLRRGDRDPARRFFASTAKTVAAAWQTATGADLALPEVPGRRSIRTRITNIYIDWVLTAGETDTAVVEAFTRVTGMLASPRLLVSPLITLRVARAMASRYCQLPQSSRLRRRWWFRAAFRP
jgi:2-polyprenyl-6-methoxyphenol hydroxylase-like FAD-dependent oxidoreductase